MNTQTLRFNSGPSYLQINRMVATQPITSFLPTDSRNPKLWTNGNYVFWTEDDLAAFKGQITTTNFVTQACRGAPQRPRVQRRNPRQGHQHRHVWLGLPEQGRPHRSRPADDLRGVLSMAPGTPAPSEQPPGWQDHFATGAAQAPFGTSPGSGGGVP